MTPYVAILLLFALVADEPEPTVRVGSKISTESVILGEMARGLIEDARVPVQFKRELGGTRILFDALKANELDIYPEFTGTISGEILAEKNIKDEASLRAALAEQGMEMSRSLGFVDTYAIGMREDEAARLGIKRISDLRRYPELKFGFSNEFLGRADCWPGVRDRYGLGHKDVRGLDHDLAYRALAGGEIQATDLYSTDAEIRQYHLRVLEDDLKFFPLYECVWLYRTDLKSRSPQAVVAVARLEGQISATEMAQMNAQVKLDHLPEARVAAGFLAKAFGMAAQVKIESLTSRLLHRLGEHVLLVIISLGAAILVSIPLGVIAARMPRGGPLILTVAGLIQTIPSLALLVFMIPWLGIGAKPALAALFLYSLLPIVRNTVTGLRDIPVSLRESAEALGLPSGTRLLRIELPMAMRSILAGIKTAAVINVGTATIGALIGAGGFGQPIMTGLRLNDVSMILYEGAIPAAVLALVVQAAFDLVERFLVPLGLRT